MLLGAALGAFAIGAAWGAVGATFGAGLAAIRSRRDGSQRAQAQNDDERAFGDDVFHVCFPSFLKRCVFSVFEGGARQEPVRRGVALGGGKAATAGNTGAN